MEDERDPKGRPEGIAGGDGIELPPRLADDIRKRRKEQRTRPKDIKRLTVKWDEATGIIVDIEFKEV